MDKQISLASNMSVIQSTGGTIKNPLTGRNIQIGNVVYKKLLKDGIIIETVKATSGNVPRLSLPNYGPESVAKQRKKRYKIRKKKYEGSSAEDKSFFSHSYSDTDSLISNLTKRQYTIQQFDLNKNTPVESEMSSAELKRYKDKKKEPVEGFVKGTRHAKTAAVSYSKQDIQALLRNAMYVKKVWAKQEARGVSPNIFNKFSQYHKKLTGSDEVSSVGSSQYSANMDYSAGSSAYKTFSDYSGSDRSLLPSSGSSKPSSSAKSSSKSSAKSSEQSDTASSANLASYPDKSVPEATRFFKNDDSEPYVEEKAIQRRGLKAAFVRGYDYIKTYPELEDSRVWKKLEKAMQKVLDDNNYKKEFLKGPAILEMQMLIKEAYQKASSLNEKKLLKYLNQDIYDLWDMINQQFGYKRYLAKNLKSSDRSVTPNLQMESYDRYSVPDASGSRTDNGNDYENEVKANGLKAMFKFGYDYVERHPELKKLPLWINLEKDMQKVLDDNNYKKYYLRAPAILAIQNLIMDAYKKVKGREDKNLIIYLYNAIIDEWDVHYGHLKHARKRYLAKNPKSSSERSDTASSANLASYPDKSVPEATSHFLLDDPYADEKAIQERGLKAAFFRGYEYIKTYPELKDSDVWKKLEKAMQKVLDDNNYKKEYLKGPAILEMQMLIKEAYQKASSTREKKLLKYLNQDIYILWDMIYQQFGNKRRKAKNLKSSDRSVTGDLQMEAYPRYSVPDASGSRSDNDYENEVKANGLKAMFKFGYDYIERHPELKELPLWINLEKDMQKVLDDNNYKKYYLRAPAILAIQNLILDAYKKAKGREDKNLIIYLHNAIIDEWDVHYGHLKHARHYQNLLNFSKYGTTKMAKKSST